MYTLKALRRGFAVSQFATSLTANPIRKATASTSVEDNSFDDNSQWPRKIFSGIQPTGSLHLGNYLGAVQKWTELQNAHDDVTFCVVDMHSITLPKDPKSLRWNIFEMMATMLACGIDPQKSTIFVQSAVREHTSLCWILSCLSTMARLGHLPQYREKTRLLKDVPLGLFIYPVLQAADIMLYKTTHVPVGEDQVQHIQLAQHLARIFNTKYGDTFPVCHAIIENKDAARIRSLRDPSKKMSKSDPDTRATINVMDEPEMIVEKIKKAVTDFVSDVNYQPDERPGVSNLVAIHSLVSGQSIKTILAEAKALDTGRYKLRVADAVVEHLRPIREKVIKQLQDRTELTMLLEAGAHKARDVANQTMNEVMQKVGLGAKHLPLHQENEAAAPKKTAMIAKKPMLIQKSTLIQKPKLTQTPIYREKLALMPMPVARQEIIIKRKPEEEPMEKNTEVPDASVPVSSTAMDAPEAASENSETQHVDKETKEVKI